MKKFDRYHVSFYASLFGILVLVVVANLSVAGLVSSPVVLVGAILWLATEIWWRRECARDRRKYEGLSERLRKELDEELERLKKRRDF
jgi:Flp pilus assembly protein TadB